VQKRNPETIHRRGHADYLFDGDAIHGPYAALEAGDSSLYTLIFSASESMVKAGYKGFESGGQKH
jgi:hypothetical protein